MVRFVICGCEAACHLVPDLQPAADDPAGDGPGHPDRLYAREYQDRDPMPHRGTFAAIATSQCASQRWSRTMNNRRTTAKTAGDARM